MQTWLSALRALQAQSVPAVLVTVAEVQGSTPREAGARMVYTVDQQYDTIGGGHLEWHVGQRAREMLMTEANQRSVRRRLERVALGPSLGQCCGGVVFLVFERLDQVDAAGWQALASHWQRGRDVWRAVPLDHSGPMQLYNDDGKALGECDVAYERPAIFRCGERKTYLAQDTQGDRWLFDFCRAYQPQVVLFGAGHVGAAIVQVLSKVPCRVLWVDEREDMLQAQGSPQITVEVTDVPSMVVDSAEPGAYYLVMTHSHALDLQLSESILKREDMAWFGLIGSHTKRQLFEHRLTDRGYTRQQLDRMICPIGITGIDGKEPMSIAIAVVAQLLQLWEQRFTPPVHASHLARPVRVGVKDLL